MRNWCLLRNVLFALVLLAGIAVSSGLLPPSWVRAAPRGVWLILLLCVLLLLIDGLWMLYRTLWQGRQTGQGAGAERKKQ